MSQVSEGDVATTGTLGTKNLTTMHVTFHVVMPSAFSIGYGARPRGGRARRSTLDFERAGDTAPL